MHKLTQLGKEGEERVAQYLERHGFLVLAKNYARTTGEIDIIATKKDLIVFVEVKLRTKSFFDLSDVITHSKQKKIIGVAKYYLSKNNQHETMSGRFDVALIDGATGQLTYLADAFRE